MGTYFCIQAPHQLEDYIGLLQVFTQCTMYSSHCSARPGIWKSIDAETISYLTLIFDPDLETNFHHDLPSCQNGAHRLNGL